jgi:hypothetical protein
MITSTIPGSFFYKPPSKAELKQARADGRETARQIAELCVLAGRSELAADFICRGLTVEQVRAALAGAGARSEPGDAAETSLVDALARQARRMDRQAADQMWDRAFAAARPTPATTH